MIDKDKLDDYLQNLESFSSEQMMERVSKHVDNEMIEVFVDHIEEFYGVEDDDELGMLAQLMISGFIAGLEINN